MTPTDRRAEITDHPTARPDEPPSSGSRAGPVRARTPRVPGRGPLLGGAAAAVAVFLVLVALLSLGVCLLLGYAGPP